MGFRNIEGGIDFKAISACVLLNIFVAGVVFILSYTLAGNLITPVFYTMVSWMVTSSVSMIFWLWWIFKRAILRQIKIMISVVVLIVQIFVLYISWSIVTFVSPFM
jgi:hypothetical protein